eukprot:TRINITY_DN4646_c0_g2_i1.p1 TRINITY_DN4646_c0_g2~~TRINITY_DN4646_c0_g2_i1.p1  ORF type:complete len:568 (+),score=107.20 TRINITY_DN4646_c0_g2_i1:97-1800(+)
MAAHIASIRNPSVDFLQHRGDVIKCRSAPSSVAFSSVRPRHVFSPAIRSASGNGVAQMGFSVSASPGGQKALRPSTQISAASQSGQWDDARSAAEDIENNVRPLMDEVAKKLPLEGNVLWAVALACVGAFLFGYHLGVVNGPLEQILMDLGAQGKTVVGGWIVSITLAGAFFGAFTGGSLADQLGRTRTFALNAIPLIVGTVLSATSTSVAAMVAGRVIVGFGIGVSSTVVPMYISEVAPTEIRGLLGAVNQLAICVGILAALVAGLPMANDPTWWRPMFWLAIPPTVALAAGMALWVPESPRWLFKQGKVVQAEESVRRLWGLPRTPAAMADLVGSAVGDVAGDSAEASWGEMFGERYGKVVALGAAIFVFQQLAGINAVVYYSSSVFRKVGIKSEVAASALVGFANVIGTGIASWLMDREGRKKLLLLSFAGMGASMLLLAVTLSWQALSPEVSGVLAVAGTVAYVLAFSLGVGPVPALLLPEIFASRIRGKAMALSLGTHWVINFFIGLSFLAVVNAVGISGVYLGFAAVCGLGCVFVQKCIVETKGRSLEEIELAMSAPTRKD